MAAALILVVAATATTFAESVTADADAVSAGDQGTDNCGSATTRSVGSLSAW